jgi:hypothetical protein
MEKLMDFLMDSAARNGPPARPSGQQETPLRGALRVNNFPTPVGFRLENEKPVFHTAPIQKGNQQQRLLEKNHTETAALRWPLLLHHLTGLRRRFFNSGRDARYHQAVLRTTIRSLMFRHKTKPPEVIGFRWFVWWS